MEYILYFFILLFLLFVIYDGIPSLWNRRVAKDILKRINKKGAVSLTFDDGPSPIYTKQVLEILKKKNVHANFFVLGEKAQKYPDIIKQIKNDGHEIGIHSYDHKCQWFFTPSKTIEDFNKTYNIVNKLGANVTLFRPPWGLFNIFTKRTAYAKNVKSVFWSIHAYDWSKYSNPKSIEKALLKVKEGNIILLHDSGGAKGAPQNTIDALENIIDNIKNKGLNFVTLTEGSKQL